MNPFQTTENEAGVTRFCRFPAAADSADSARGNPPSPPCQGGIGQADICRDAGGDRFSAAPPPHSGILARALRLAGVALLAIAATDFLLGGVAQSETYRYWVLPGFCVALALCGLVSGYLWRETLGARLFFGLAAALQAVQFSQVGALWYGQSAGAPPVAAYLPWLNGALTLALFFPVAYTAFAMLARRRAGWLTGLMLAGSALLVLPTRASLPVTLLLLAQFVGLRYADRRCFRGDAFMGLAEGLAARAMLWIPFAILLGRSFFYPVATFQQAALLAMGALALAVDLTPLCRSRIGAGLVQMLGLMTGAWAWLVLAYGFLAPALWAEENLLVYVPVGALLLVLSPHLVWPRFSRALGALAVVLALSGAGDGHTAAVAAIVCGAILAYTGFQLSERVPLLTGLAAFLWGLGKYSGYAAEFYSANSWLALALLSVTVLLAASYIEKERPALARIARRCAAIVLG